jgi:aldehyde:ferredoxin oxidoreductase
MGLGYATSDRGACHLRATFYKPELAGMIPKEQIEGKAELFMDFEDRLTLFDTLILCRFYRDLYTWEGLGQVIHAATGLSSEQADIQKIAGAVSDRVRCFNLREGLTVEDDSLSKGFYRKLTNTDQVITENQLQVMIKEYYALRGWSEQGEVACS